MNILEKIRSHKASLEKIGAQYGASNIRIFGSVARNDARPESDIDLLITFDTNRSGFDLGGFQYYASQLLGRRVDVVMDHHIHAAFKESIVRESLPL